MCGIFSVITPELDNHRAELVLNSLNHRGPDARGMMSYRNLHLLHTRLSIQDLSQDANQPFISEDGRYALIFNGEIYNHKELRNQLSFQNFKTQSDTETLLYGLIEEAELFIPKLNGMFAFVFLDKKTNTVLVSRDRFGIKPLYFYWHDNLLAFSSEIRPFRYLPGFDPKLNYNSLRRYTQYLFDPTNETPFHYVHKFPKGNFCKVNLGEKREQLGLMNYYQTNIGDPLDKGKLDVRQAGNELDKLLSNSVRSHLLSDVPVGILLSGGLDSSMLAGVMTEKDLDSISTAYCVNNQELLEEEGFEADCAYSRDLAKSRGINFESVSVKNGFSHLVEVMNSLDEPIADTAIFNLDAACSKAHAFGEKVLLSGLGADDIFTGYRRHFVARHFESFKAISRIAPQFLLSKSNQRRIRKLRSADNIFDLFNWTTYEHSRLLFDQEVRMHFKEDSFPECNGNHVSTMLKWEQDHFLPNSLLLQSDKVGMKHSIEVRVPYLENELVHFANNLPLNLKIKGTLMKFLLRELGKKYLPEKVINRSKTGFGFPMRSYIKNSSDIRDILCSETFKRRGIYNQIEIENMLKLNQQGIDNSYTIWSLVCIELWLRNFADV